MSQAFGRINQDGTLDTSVANKGVLTTNRTGEGRYEIVYHSGTFTEPPVVVASVMNREDDQTCDTSATDRTVSILRSNSTKFCVGVKKASGDESDRPITFIAQS